MTLQYDNSGVLWAGLQLYGSLLAGILSIGLVLTTLLPVIGNTSVQTQFLITVFIISSHDDCKVREVRAQNPPS